MTSKFDGCCLFSVLLQEPTAGSEQCQHTEEFAMGQDRNVLQCLSSMLQVEELPSHSHDVASLLLTLGSLGVGRGRGVEGGEGEGDGSKGSRREGEGTGRSPPPYKRGISNPPSPPPPPLPEKRSILARKSRSFFFFLFFFLRAGAQAGPKTPKST